MRFAQVLGLLEILLQPVAALSGIGRVSATVIDSVSLEELQDLPVGRAPLRPGMHLDGRIRGRGFDRFLTASGSGPAQTGRGEKRSSMHSAIAFRLFILAMIERGRRSGAAIERRRLVPVVRSAPHRARECSSG